MGSGQSITKPPKRKERPKSTAHNGCVSSLAARQQVGESALKTAAAEQPGWVLEAHTDFGSRNV